MKWRKDHDREKAKRSLDTLVQRAERHSKSLRDSWIDFGSHYEDPFQYWLREPSIYRDNAGVFWIDWAWLCYIFNIYKFGYPWESCRESSWPHFLANKRIGFYGKLISPRSRRNGNFLVDNKNSGNHHWYRHNIDNWSPPVSFLLGRRIWAGQATRSNPSKMGDKPKSI